MPKVTLEYNLPEETESYSDAMDGTRLRTALTNVWEQCFRPRHKHGFSNDKINKLLENEDCNALMDELEELYRECMEDL